MMTLVELSNVNGKPKVLLGDLSSPLRVGDTVALHFTIRKMVGGRLQKLEVDGAFRVTSVSFDARTFPSKQILCVEADEPPRWRSVKKPSTPSLSPTHPPPTRIR